MSAPDEQASDADGNGSEQTRVAHGNDREQIDEPLHPPADDGRRRGRYLNSPVDRAAGAVLAHEGRVAVVHRPRYDDWSLPKGHVARGETWLQAALREVTEETGVVARAVTSGRPCTYLVGHELPKVVMFYAMVPAQPPEPLRGDGCEVDEAHWWLPEQAVAQLSYAVEVAAFEALWPIAAAQAG